MNTTSNPDTPFAVSLLSLEKRIKYVCMPSHILARFEHFAGNGLMIASGVLSKYSGGTLKQSSFYGSK